MANSEQTGHVLRIHPDDNVGVVTEAVPRGGYLEAGDYRCKAERDLALGDKIALEEIATGEHIVKYGFPIGSATRDIALCEWVHLQNMKSDYVATYVFEK